MASQVPGIEDALTVNPGARRGSCTAPLPEQGGHRRRRSCVLCLVSCARLLACLAFVQPAARRAIQECIIVRPMLRQMLFWIDTRRAITLRRREARGRRVKEASRSVRQDGAWSCVFACCPQRHSQRSIRQCCDVANKQHQTSWERCSSAISADSTGSTNLGEETLNA